MCLELKALAALVHLALICISVHCTAAAAAAAAHQIFKWQLSRGQFSVKIIWSFLANFFIKLTVWGMIVCSDLCISWCYCISISITIWPDSLKLRYWREWICARHGFGDGVSISCVCIRSNSIVAKYICCTMISNMCGYICQVVEQCTKCFFAK